jgi:REP element-mobilizing transposase RayT
MAGTYTQLLYHIVFSTKERRQLIMPAIRDELYHYIGGIIRGEDGALDTIGGTRDHVHILARIPPTVAVSDMLRRIKSNSSKWAHERARFAWQSGYGAFSVSTSGIPDVRAYIEAQEDHHKKMSFKEEFLSMLKKHNIEYDEKYIWD